MSTNSRFAVAVHILTLLARSEEPVPSSLIAGSVGTNAALIRRLMQSLTEAGLVTSQKGANGGALLARPAKDISLQEVYYAVDAPTLIALHHSQPHPLCPVGRNITGVLTDVVEHAQHVVDQALGQRSIADIAQDIARRERLTKGV